MIGAGQRVLPRSDRSRAFLRDSRCLKGLSIRMTSTTTKSLIIYWIVTSLLAVAFVGMGVSNYWQPGTMNEDIAKSGYPPHFFKFLGVCQVLGGVVILAPKLPLVKEWAYAGIFVNLIAASHHHVMAGDGAVRIGIPLVIMLLVALSYLLRPSSRRVEGLLKLEGVF